MIVATSPRVPHVIRAVSPNMTDAQFAAQMVRFERRMDRVAADAIRARIVSLLPPGTVIVDDHVHDSGDWSPRPPIAGRVAAIYNPPAVTLVVDVPDDEPIRRREFVETLRDWFVIFTDPIIPAGLVVVDRDGRDKGRRP